MSIKGGLGGWCARVEGGKNKDDKLNRLKEVPEQYRNDVIKHMRLVNKLAEKSCKLKT